MSDLGVTLTSIGAADAETLFRWINDPKTVHFNAPYKPVHWTNHEDWIRSLGTTPTKVVFAIRAGSELVGVTQLIDIDPIHRSAELTIRIGEESKRGRGYGTKAVTLLLKFAWVDLNLHRVWLRVFANNKRAIRSYFRAGFLQEGTMKEAAYIDGGYVDVCVLGQLRPNSV